MALVAALVGCGDGGDAADGDADARQACLNYVEVVRRVYIDELACDQPNDPTFDELRRDCDDVIRIAQPDVFVEECLPELELMVRETGCDTSHAELPASCLAQMLVE